jgi:hypothetical protein
MTATDPPDRLPDGHALTELYQKRARMDADLFAIISDRHNRRGTGKTTLTLRLAHAFDRTDEGVTDDKATLSVDALTDAYTDQRSGSALILDEAEAGVSKYDAGTQSNRAMRKLVSMGRVEEKYVLMNLPNSGEMDRDLKALADVWIIVNSRGTAECHILGYNPWGEHPIVRETDLLEFDAIPDDHQLTNVYDELTAEKRRRLRGESDDADAMVSVEEMESRIESAKEDARRDERDKILDALYGDTDLTQRELASAADISRSHLANIVSGD